MVEPHAPWQARRSCSESWTSEPRARRDALRRPLRQPLPAAHPACRRLDVRLRRGRRDLARARAGAGSAATSSTASRTCRTSCCTGCSPSRYCESDVLADDGLGAVRRRRRRAPSACRPSATGSTRNVAYGVASMPTTTTIEIFDRRGGMCRDFAHLGVTFCRALGIPARYVVRLHAGHRHPRPVPADGLPRLVRGLARRSLVDVRRALQHAAHRPASRSAAGATPPTSPWSRPTGAATLERHDGVGRRGHRARRQSRPVLPVEAGYRMSDDALGDLIATLGSIDHDEIDWQNVQRTTVLIHQHFRYAYPGPVSELRQRLMVVPPDFHDDQRLVTHKMPRLGLQRRHRALLRHVRQRRPRLQRSRRSSTTVDFSDLGRRRARGVGRRQRRARRARRRTRASPSPRGSPQPDDALRAAAEPLRASGASGLELAEQIGHARARALHLRLGHHRRRDDGRRGLGRRRRRVPGLRPLHARPLPAVRPARALRLGPPARRGRHPRLGRGARAAPAGSRGAAGRGVRPDPRSPPRAALRHRRRRARLRRRATDVGHVRGRRTAAS